MFRRSRRLRASNVAALLVAVLLLAACGSPSRASSGAAPTISPVTSVAATVTHTVTFAPFSTGGAISVAAPISGSCWTASIAAPAAATYRCLAHNQILDPCFAPAATDPSSPAIVACFTAPWSKGIQVAVTSLPKADGTVQANPWALELANGVRCVTLTGTVRTVGSVDLTYRCGTAGSAGLITAARPGAARAVEYAATAKAALVRVGVSTIWRG